MQMNLTGTIKVSPRRLKVDGVECMGTTRVKGTHFSILISEKENKETVQFMETLLHEILHLYFFIMMSLKSTTISEDKQHRVLDAVVPFMLNKMALELAPKRRHRVTNS